MKGVVRGGCVGGFGSSSWAWVNWRALLNAWSI